MRLRRPTQGRASLSHRLGVTVSRARRAGPAGPALSRAAPCLGRGRGTVLPDGTESGTCHDGPAGGPDSEADGAARSLARVRRRRLGVTGTPPPGGARRRAAESLAGLALGWPQHT
jgi:hypothetical protein